MTKLTAFAGLFMSVTALASTPISYELSFENAAHHEARISVSIADIGDAPLQLRMSQSSPGRYALHNFAKNVYAVSIVDAEGQALAYSQSAPNQWTVPEHGGTVTMTYTLYADRAGGTYSGIDLTHAHLNMPATLVWAKGFEDRPVTVTFNPVDPAWKVATQLAPTDNRYVFTAPNFQYLMDSPVELSNHQVRSWQVGALGNEQTIQIALHHDGTDEDLDVFSEKGQKVVAEQIAVFGEPPNFDYGTYTFIADFLPYIADDGMEHRNSTILAYTKSLHEDEFKWHLDVLSHEFFHAWNVERIRPERLEPFDFEKPNMSLNLWFAEGFSNYYGPLTIRRAGESTVDEFAEFLTADINHIALSPGRAYSSLQGMSSRAPYVDAAASIDPDNFGNTFINYYNYGATIGLALDLTLRDKYRDVTLDTLMREMWRAHGENEIPYATEDVEKALASVTDDAQFAQEFFAAYITGSELPDFEALLDNAGLILRKANEGAATAGAVTFEFDGKAAIIQNNTLVGSPIYVAGLDRGDQVLAIDRLKIQSQEQWDAALERYEPGDTATIYYVQREIERSAEISFTEDQTLEVVTFESDDQAVSRAKKAFRTRWLGEEIEE